MAAKVKKGHNYGSTRILESQTYSMIWWIEALAKEICLPSLLNEPFSHLRRMAALLKKLKY